jgi:hypothetical protein
LDDWGNEEESEMTTEEAVDDTEREMAKVLSGALEETSLLATSKGTGGSGAGEVGSHGWANAPVQERTVAMSRQASMTGRKDERGIPGPVRGK